MRRLAMAMTIVAAIATAGCKDPARNGISPDGPSDAVKIHKLTEQVEQLQATVRTQQAQIAKLQALGDKRMATLFHVNRIELGRHTGGLDTDGKPGDDAIVVYVQPIDQHGSILKCAGSVTVRIFDLAEEDETKTLIGTHRWTAEEIAKTWPAGFMGRHFRLLCPWQSAPPKHPTLTIRIAFTDYLTGKTHTAQKTCTVKVPAEK